MYMDETDQAFQLFIPTTMVRHTSVNTVRTTGKVAPLCSIMDITQLTMKLETVYDIII